MRLQCVSLYIIIYSSMCFVRGACVFFRNKRNTTTPILPLIPPTQYVPYTSLHSTHLLTTHPCPLLFTLPPTPNQHLSTKKRTNQRVYLRSTRIPHITCCLPCYIVWVQKNATTLFRVIASCLFYCSCYWIGCVILGCYWICSCSIRLLLLLFLLLPITNIT